MNKSESKYFNTSIRMDKAFLELLGEKDFAYITVKDICERAGVNRSTFYLHYETVADLLQESLEYLFRDFLDYFQTNTQSVVSRLRDCPLEELYLVTPTYLTPYLSYIKEHKHIFRTAVDNAIPLRLEGVYAQMFRHVFMPILDRLKVPEQDRHYIMSFYIYGMMAIISEWLKSDCSDSIEQVSDIIVRCVMKERRLP